MPSPRLLRRVLLAAPLGALLAPPPVATAATIFVTLGDLPGGATFARALSVSADGSVVAGVSQAAAGNRVFRWTEATGMVSIGLDLTESEMSGDGSTIVGHTSSAMLRWTEAGGVQTLPPLPNTLLRGPISISGDGTKVVMTALGAPTQGALWTTDAGTQVFAPGGAFARPFDMSYDGSRIVGITSNSIATLWDDDGTSIVLGVSPGADFSTPSVISADGTTVFGRSGSNATPGTSATFRWTPAGGYEEIPELFDFSVLGVSGDGALAAVVRVSGATVLGGVWDESAGFRDVRSLLNGQGIDTAGWSSVRALGVSDDGRTLVGSGIDSSGTTQAWLARRDEGWYGVAGVPVPEPRSSLLALLGCIAVWATRRVVTQRGANA